MPKSSLQAQLFFTHPFSHETLTRTVAYRAKTSPWTTVKQRQRNTPTYFTRFYLPIQVFSSSHAITQGGELVDVVMIQQFAHQS